MSGTWPTSPVPRAIEWLQWRPAFVDESHSLQRYVRTRGGQRWVVTLRYNVLTRDAWAPLNAFVQQQAGPYEKFNIVLQGPGGTPRGTVAGTVLANGAAAVGASSVAVDGITVGRTWKAGDPLKFANHVKVYVLAADATVNGSGQATLSITPPLQEAVADNEAITYTSVPMQCSLADDRHGVTYGPLYLSEPLVYQLIEDPTT
jgi:hypothetical protein